MPDRLLFASAVPDSSWPERARRGWTTLTSFGLQALLTSVLLLLPILRPAGLSSLHRLSTPISLGAALPRVSAVRLHPGSTIASSRPAGFYFRRPSPLPAGHPPENEEGALRLRAPDPIFQASRNKAIPTASTCSPEGRSRCCRWRLRQWPRVRCGFRTCAKAI